MFGDKQSWNNQSGYPTPTEIPVEVATRSFCIPGSTAWLALVMGCLMQLADEKNWQVFDGGISAEDAAAAAQEIIDSGYDGTCSTGTNEVQTPFWDDATDVDDDADPSSQTWYGEVDDPEAPPDELTFTENLLIWAFDGMLAVSGSPGAAIAFQTIAPQFVLKMRGGSVAEVIRVLIDGYEAGRLDTSGHDGEILTLPVTGDPDLSSHQLYVIKVS